MYLLYLGSPHCDTISLDVWCTNVFFKAKLSRQAKPETILIWNLTYFCYLEEGGGGGVVARSVKHSEIFSTFGGAPYIFEC